MAGPARVDTIVALASGRPPAAIAVVRVSGLSAIEIAAALTRTTLPPPRRLALRRLYSSDGAPLDDAMIAVFPGPASATGEDLAELHLHGGPAVVADVLAEVTRRAGVRLAQPGEFTRRAFDNGRLDLTQVEGLADLINAETASQRSQALALAGGALGRAAEVYRERGLALLADAEAALDFAEDEADVAERMVRNRTPQIFALTADIDSMLADSRRAGRIRNGLVIAVVGAPNSGKSSLVNILTMMDAAIVTAVPGTTRDLIEVPLDLGGVAAVLVDTAGLRESDDIVEQEGIRRALARAADADLVLHVADTMPDVPLGVVVINKSDLGTSSPDGVLHVSALRGDGINKLRSWLATWAAETVRPGEPALLGVARHRDSFAEARDYLAEAAGETDMVLAAASLRLAVRAFGRVTGRVGVEDVLDRIFSQFCIGK